MTLIPLPPALADELRHVEQIVLERTRSRAAVISVSGARLLAPGAERTRAALVLLAAQTGTYQRERVQHAAAAAELIHAATQTHDDLVDEAARRRGHPRDGAWNHAVALMVGDYLFALAAGEMALSPDPRVISFYAHAVMRITESTLEPPPALSPLAVAQERHLQRLSGAYGALFGAACRAGGACVGAPAEQIEALGSFGEQLGIALRLNDELHAFAVPAGADLRAGILSLPLIFAVAHGDGARLSAALDSADVTEQAWVAAEVRRYGLVPTRAEITRLANAARSALDGVPFSAARTALLCIADYVEQQANSA